MITLININITKCKTVYIYYVFMLSYFEYWNVETKWKYKLIFCICSPLNRTEFLFIFLVHSVELLLLLLWTTSRQFFNVKTHTHILYSIFCCCTYNFISVSCVLPIQEKLKRKILIFFCFVLRHFICVFNLTLASYFVRIIFFYVWNK